VSVNNERYSVTNSQIRTTNNGITKACDELLRMRYKAAKSTQKHAVL